MKHQTSTILAVGSTGKFAGLVLPALTERGAKVRGLTRHDADAAAVRAHGATDVAIGDLNKGFDKAKANTDLVERFRTNAPMDKPDPSTFYGMRPKGYTDYPALGARALASTD